MVQKIAKVKVEKTVEQEQNEWAEVLSHRNKLLLNSDWTQLPDSGLTEQSAQQWKDWRSMLKNITQSNFGDHKLAERHITRLSRRMPFSTFIPNDVEPDFSRCVSLDEYRRRVFDYMDAAFNKRAVPSFLDNPYLVDEQFKEAADFRSKGESGSYPLIATTAELYGMSKSAVADEFITRKVEQMKRLANLKQKYFYFQQLVNSATDDVQLTEVQAEIKQWISTST